MKIWILLFCTAVFSSEENEIVDLRKVEPDHLWKCFAKKCVETVVVAGVVYSVGQIVYCSYYGQPDVYCSGSNSNQIQIGASNVQLAIGTVKELSKLGFCAAAMPLCRLTSKVGEKCGDLKRWAYGDSTLNRLSSAADEKVAPSQFVDSNRFELHEKQLEMFENFLKNTSGVDVQVFLKKFENLERPDFFRIKAAYEFFKIMSNTEALEEAMKSKYENINFDKVNRMIPYAQKIHELKNDQIQMALDPKYHKLPFDKIDAVQKQFYEDQNSSQTFQFTPDAVKKLIKPGNENLDWDKVARMIPYAQKFYHHYAKMALNLDLDLEDQVGMALDPKYHKMPFDKIDAVQKKFDITDNWAIHELVKPQNENLDWDKVARMIPYARKIEWATGSQIQMAVDPKYHKLPFDKIDAVQKKFDINEGIGQLVKPQNEKLDWDKVARMMPYVQKMKIFHPYKQIQMAVDPKHHKLDFDKIDAVQKKFKIRDSHALLQLVKPENEKLDWDKVARMIPYAKQIERRPREQIEMAVDPKYHKLDFDKNDFVHNLLHMRFPDLNNLAKEDTENLKWDQVLSIFSFNKRIRYYNDVESRDFNDVERVKMAVDPNHQNLDKSDFEKIGSVYNFLQPLEPYGYNEKIQKEIVALALEPWIQDKGFKIEKAKEIARKCKKEKGANLKCWKLKTKEFKKSDL